MKKLDARMQRKLDHVWRMYQRGYSVADAIAITEGKRRKKQATVTPQAVKFLHDGAMQFDEIGRELGITRQYAQMIFAAAIRKLARQPRLINELRGLVAMRRPARSYGEQYQELA